jgi:hypothetical protein
MPATPLALRLVNANVFSLHQADGMHVGNLKRIGGLWKFKAVGYETDGSVVPGGGPLTNFHNTTFATPDVVQVNTSLGSRPDPDPSYD